MNKVEVGEALVRALSEGKDADFNELSEAASTDLVLSTFIDGETQGREAVLDVLKRAQAGGMYTRTIEWKKIDADATPMRVEAVLPPSAFPAGYTWDLSFNDAGEVTKIQQANVRPIGPAPATPIKLTEAMVDALANALENGTPTIAAYVNEHGQPSMSTRGTTQVFSDNEIALWARSRDTGMAKAVKQNPLVSVFYYAHMGKPASGSLQFQGRARVEEDQAICDRVYEGSPALEQRADPERKGIAIIIELDKVSGLFARTRYNMVKNVD
ncbi:MAG: pyridoxamine 5'-phosphate oxidase family protein [Chloroflexi bacterium]|nr:pyridoxamine 5'-phosphate oxidase family protein [Chloroflexota bacterium]